MAEGSVTLPAELAGCQPAVLEGYVRARLLDFLGRPEVAGLLGPALQSALQEAAQQAAAGAAAAVGVSGQQGARPQLELIFRHDCQHLGCADLHCILCSQNQQRRCARCFQSKYLSGDVIRAACGAAIRVELVDRATKKVMDLPNLAGAKLEMCILNGKALEGLTGVTLTDDNLNGISLLTNPQGQPLLACRQGENGTRGHVVAALAKGSAPLPDIFVAGSSEAILSGQKPPFVLMVRLVGKEGERVTGVKPLLSDGFVVATPRVRTAAKKDIPHITDHISKLHALGNATQAKLRELSKAVEEAGLQPLGVPFTSVTKVGEFRQLVAWAEQEPQRCDRIRKMLKLTKGWDEARDHAYRAVGDDSRLRVWFTDPTLEAGLLFGCEGALPDFDQPLALVERVQASDGASTLQATLLGTTSSSAAPEELPAAALEEAKASWTRRGHPGWAILEMTTDYFNQACGHLPTVMLPPSLVADCVPPSMRLVAPAGTGAGAAGGQSPTGCGVGWSSPLMGQLGQDGMVLDSPLLLLPPPSVPPSPRSPLTSHSPGRHAAGAAMGAGAMGAGGMGTGAMGAGGMASEAGAGMAPGASGRGPGAGPGLGFLPAPAPAPAPPMQLPVSPPPGQAGVQRHRLAGIGLEGPYTASPPSMSPVAGSGPGSHRGFRSPSPAAAPAAAAAATAAAAAGGAGSGSTDAPLNQLVSSPSLVLSGTPLHVPQPIRPTPSFGPFSSLGGPSISLGPLLGSRDMGRLLDSPGPAFGPAGGSAGLSLQRQWQAKQQQELGDLEALEASLAQRLPSLSRLPSPTALAALFSGLPSFDSLLATGGLAGGHRGGHGSIAAGDAVQEAASGGLSNAQAEQQARLQAVGTEGAVSGGRGDGGRGGGAAELGIAPLVTNGVQGHAPSGAAGTPQTQQGQQGQPGDSLRLMQQLNQVDWKQLMREAYKPYSEQPQPPQQQGVERTDPASPAGAAANPASATPGPILAPASSPGPAAAAAAAAAAVGPTGLPSNAAGGTARLQHLLSSTSDLLKLGTLSGIDWEAVLQETEQLQGTDAPVAGLGGASSQVERPLQRMLTPEWQRLSLNALEWAALLQELQPGQQEGAAQAQQQQGSGVPPPQQQQWEGQQAPHPAQGSEGLAGAAAGAAVGPVFGGTPLKSLGQQAQGKGRGKRLLSPSGSNLASMPVD